MPNDTRVLFEKIQALPPNGYRRSKTSWISSRLERRIVHLRERRPPQVHSRSRRCGRIQKTTSTMPFDFGDVVLVPFLFTSQAASKKRPAVVVSSRTYNHTKPDIVVMAITSQLRATPAFGEVWLQD